MKTNSKCLIEKEVNIIRDCYPVNLWNCAVIETYLNITYIMFFFIHIIITQICGGRGKKIMAFFIFDFSCQNLREGWQYGGGGGVGYLKYHKKLQKSKIPFLLLLNL